MACLIAVVGTGCGGSSKTTTTQASVQSACTKVTAATPQPSKEHLKPPTSQLPAGSVWDVKFTTNCGSFTVRVAASAAPKTAASVVSLARTGFYDGLSIHRLAPGFVIQGGDPQGTGAGGPGYTTVEPPASKEQYARGTVAMAKTGTQPAGTAGSQFFVATGEALGLPPDYAVLGKVVSGMDTVDLISAQKINPKTDTGNDGAPASPIVFTSVTVTRVS